MAKEEKDQAQGGAAEEENLLESLFKKVDMSVPEGAEPQVNELAFREGLTRPVSHPMTPLSSAGRGQVVDVGAACSQGDEGIDVSLRLRHADPFAPADPITRDVGGV